MKKLINITIISFLMTLVLSCNNDSITQPKEDQPGRRDYVWTVDTVNSDPYKTLYRLWGDSPSDIWALASGGDINSNIFHFDGINWSTGIYSLPYGPISIYGFTNNNFYIGTDGGRIYHFNGSTFEVIAALTKDGNSNIAFSIWGNSPYHFYAFGAYPDNQGLYNGSVIAEFNDNQWTILNIDGIQGNIAHLYKNSTDAYIYFQIY